MYTWQNKCAQPAAPAFKSIEAVSASRLQLLRSMISRAGLQGREHLCCVLERVLCAITALQVMCCPYDPNHRPTPSSTQILCASNNRCWAWRPGYLENILQLTSEQQALQQICIMFDFPTLYPCMKYIMKCIIFDLLTLYPCMKCTAARPGGHRRWDKPVWAVWWTCGQGGRVVCWNYACLCLLAPLKETMLPCLQHFVLLFLSQELWAKYATAMTICPSLSITRAMSNIRKSYELELWWNSKQEAHSLVWTSVECHLGSNWLKSLPAWVWPRSIEHV